VHTIKEQKKIPTIFECVDSIFEANPRCGPRKSIFLLKFETEFRYVLLLQYVQYKPCLVHFTCLQVCMLASMDENFHTFMHSDGNFFFSNICDLFVFVFNV
jgi:hypothetical protein